jgi:hypothetical protein
MGDEDGCKSCDESSEISQLVTLVLQAEEGAYEMETLGDPDADDAETLIALARCNCQQNAASISDGGPAGNESRHIIDSINSFDSATVMTPAQLLCTTLSLYSTAKYSKCSLVGSIKGVVFAAVVA